MARTLTEAAKASTTILQQGIVETFILNSPILDRYQPCARVGLTSFRQMG